VNTNPGRSIAVGVGALACLLSACSLAGCRGDRSADRPHQFFPDMDDSPKYKPQTASPVFADGRSMQPPVAGVVAFGMSTDENAPDRRWIHQDNDAAMLGLNPDGSYVDRMPLRAILGVADGEQIAPADAERFVLLGQNRYNVFCYPCHGAAGDGKGIVGNLWSTLLPSYHDARFQRGGENGQDGYFFHTIRNGLPNTPGVMPALRMPSYSDRVSIEEAWSIVSYLRALQKTQSGELRDVPESVADGLLATRGAAVKPSNTTTQEPAP
jgi:mono/diheme cytochrome c family protein